MRCRKDWSTAKICIVLYGRSRMRNPRASDMVSFVRCSYGKIWPTNKSSDVTCFRVWLNPCTFSPPPSRSPPRAFVTVDEQVQVPQITFWLFRISFACKVVARSSNLSPKRSQPSPTRILGAAQTRRSEPLSGHLTASSFESRQTNDLH
jgi:hypothetical protein